MQYLRNLAQLAGTTALLWLGAVGLVVLAGQTRAAALAEDTLLPALLLGCPVLAAAVLAGRRAHRRRRAERHAAAEEDERRRLAALVDHHRPALARNLRRAYRVNDYGAVIRDTRARAAKEFLDSVGLPSLLPLEEAIRLAILQTYSHEAAAALESSLPEDPAAFEDWVADRLRRRGWAAETTDSGPDQGIDVIARKGDRRVGLQCKLYSQPVGNKAVQEAVSGKYFYGLDKAAVVTNASYTASADELAEASDVALLHITDLADPDRLLMR